MERKASVERTKPIFKGLNITPNDIFDLIKSYGEGISSWKKFLDSPDFTARSNTNTFISMERERLHLLTSSSPEGIINTLNKIYVDANKFQEEGLDILNITTKIIRKYRSVYDYADLFLATKNSLLDRIADNEFIARDKERKRLGSRALTCDISLTLEDYNALDRDAPQKLKENPGKTMLETMADEEITLYINRLKETYNWAKQAKNNRIYEYGQIKYDEDIKKEGIFWHTIQIWIDSYLETMKYIKSKGKLPKNAFKIYGVGVGLAKAA
jgi:hypothetical protein